MPTSNKYQLLADWQAKNDAKNLAISEERDLRSQVIEAFSEETDEMASGTENVDIGQGYDLKIIHALDYKCGANDEIDAALDEIEKSMEGGAIIAERLIKWKPEISVSEYKKLDATQKAIIDRVLTIKPAAKSIKIHKRGK